MNGFFRSTGDKIQEAIQDGNHYSNEVVACIRNAREKLKGNKMALATFEESIRHYISKPITDKA